MVYFGLGDDPRVRAAFAFLIEDMSTDDALDCGRYQHQDCLWGAIAALNGLAALPADMHSALSKQVVKRSAGHPDNLEIPYRFAARRAVALWVGSVDPQDSLRKKSPWLTGSSRRDPHHSTAI